MPDLPTALQQFLLEGTAQLLNSSSRLRPEALTDFGPAAASIWAGLSCPAPIAGQARLYRLATRIGDCLATQIRQQLRPNNNPPHLPAYHLADMLAALRPALPTPRRQRWQRVLEQSATILCQYLQNKWQQLGKPGPYTGTGPNHLFRHAATLFRIGRVLARPAWARRGSAAIRRLVQLQDPRTGCFPEHNGPVVAYHWVSLDGLARYLSSGGDKFALPALQRGIEFGLQQLYPDLVRLELFDERNRLWQHEPPSLRCHTCIYHPQGRRLISLLLQRCSDPALYAGHPRRGQRLGLLLSDIAHALSVGFDSTQQPLPVESPAMTIRLADYGLLRRRDGWFYGLSRLSSAAPPHHPYHMDRTANIALYHDRAGRIIAGGNDKHTLESATFRIIESGECGYFPALTGRIRRGRHTDRLELDYGAARASLSVTVSSPRLCRLDATTWTNMRWRQTDLNLQLPVPLGSRIRLGRHRRTRILQPDRPTRHWPTGGRLELPGRWRIETVPDALLIWPYLAYNCYGGPPHRLPPDQAVAILRVPLEPTRPRASLALRVL